MNISNSDDDIFLRKDNSNNAEYEELLRQATKEKIVGLYNEFLKNCVVKGISKSFVCTINIKGAEKPFLARATSGGYKFTPYIKELVSRKSDLITFYVPSYLDKGYTIASFSLPSYDKEENEKLINFLRKS